MNPLAITGIFEIGKALLDRFFPDPQKKAEAELELLRMQQSGELAQLASATDLAKLQSETNTVEAASTNVFIAGWRPFIGWVCGSAFAYNFVAQPFLLFFAVWVGDTETATKLATMPKLDWTEISTVLLGMLGLGGFRTFEKVKGVESNR